MRIAACALLTLALWIIDSRASNGVELVAQRAMDRCDDVSIQLGGPLEQYLSAVSANWLQRAPRDNPAIFDMFVDRDAQPYRNLLPWSGEFAGKLLTGSVQVLRTTDDPTLKAATTQFVERLLPLQAEDGYLGPFPQESRLTGTAPNCPGNWDLWGHYHAMLGLMLWYDETGDPHALEAARRVGDLLCAKFLDTGKPVSSIGSMEMNQAVVHSLAMLYARTGEEKYLKLAEEVVADFAAPGAGDYLRMGLQGVEFFQIPKPRWESLHPMMGLAELYWLTGNEDYRKAFENLWWSIVKTDRHNNGGFSSGEQAQGNPYHQGAIETCCTIAWMAMSVEMLRLTGDPLVADELELSTLNQAVGAFAPTARWSTYNTPMDGRRIPSTQDIAFQIRPGSEELNCCSVNAARGLGMISDWGLMRDVTGLALNWYGPSTFETTVKETPVTLTQTTDYPRDGRIELAVEPRSPVAFNFKLRIPHWSAKTKVTVNGEAVAATPGTYLSLDREWKSGDRVTIEIDMSARYWAGERECAGKTSVYRGPVLLVAEGGSAGRETFGGTWNSPGPPRASNVKGAQARLEFAGDSVEWRGAYYDDAGKARVTIDGQEAAIVDQYGPQRGVPFSWKKLGLGPGKHLLLIESLGEKRPESSNNWINVSALDVPVDAPALTTTALANGKLGPASDQSIVTFNVQDATGREVRLRDFATAGYDAPYLSWLQVVGAPATEFTRKNPSRTAIAK
ncbi:MAG: hypothetical protein C0485_03705 [Pirellula sp.]|nr:hypothetical protein [Pirellula sp.]